MIDPPNYLRTLGTLAPSSKSLAMAMTKLVDKNVAQTILEVGAGTGAITKHLLTRLGAEHKVDVVEIMPRLASILRRRFAKEASLNIHAIDLLKFDPDYKYDLIISSLPFNSLHSVLTKALIDKIIDLAKPGAHVVFFEYKIVQKFITFFLSKKVVEDFKNSRSIVVKFINSYQIEEQVVSCNIPPALVHYLCVNK